jgi:hypothetical protein
MFFHGGAFGIVQTTFSLSAFWVPVWEIYRALICCGGSNHFQRGKQQLPRRLCEDEAFSSHLGIFRPRKLKTRV